MKHSTTICWIQTTRLVLSSLLSLTAFASAKPVENRFTEGNQAYLNGDYAGAIRCYETILQQEGVSAGLLHNLARAYQANGDLGRARLNFERARWLAPRGAPTGAGRQELQQDAAGWTDADSRWSRPFLVLSLNEWTWLAAAAWAVCGGLILARGLAAPRLPFKTSLVVSSVLLAAGLGGIAIRLMEMDRAVVLGDQACLRVSPYASAHPIAMVPEGSPLRVTGAHGGFFKVQTTTGQTGWMAATEVGRITVLEARPSEDSTKIDAVDGPGATITDAGSGA